MLLYLAVFSASVLAYLLLIANGLTNTYDGMWAGSYYRDYAWVLTIGRWFWPFIGYGRLHISPEPFTSFVALALFSAGACLAVDLFHGAGNFRGYTAALLMLVNTAVCSSLSYRYMSPTFGMAFFLSVAAVWFLHARERFGWILAAGCVTLALGAYQADIGCTCVLILLLLIEMVSEGETFRKTAAFAAKAAAALAVSCILYKLIWNFWLAYFHLETSGYKGADRLTVSHMLERFPYRFQDAFQEFAGFYFENHIKHNAFQEAGIYKPVFLLFVLLFLRMAWIAAKKAAWRGAVILFLAAMIPAAANIAMLMAPDGGGLMVQMTMPEILVVSMPVCFFRPEEGAGKALRTLYLVPVICTVFLLYGSFLMVSTDQQVMLDSRHATVQLMNRVIGDLEMREDVNTDLPMVFLGTPAKNSDYQTCDLWDYANPYARYGAFWTDGGTGTYSYKALMQYCGVRFSVNMEEDLWHELEKRPELQAMPAFPGKGCVKEIDGVIVVKMSDY